MNHRITCFILLLICIYPLDVFTQDSNKNSIELNKLQKDSTSISPSNTSTNTKKKEKKDYILEVIALIISSASLVSAFLIGRKQIIIQKKTDNDKMILQKEIEENKLNLQTKIQEQQRRLAQNELNLKMEIETREKSIAYANLVSNLIDKLVTNNSKTNLLAMHAVIHTLPPNFAADILAEMIADSDTEFLARNSLNKLVIKLFSRLFGEDKERREMVGEILVHVDTLTEYNIIDFVEYTIQDTLRMKNKEAMRWLLRIFKRICDLQESIDVKDYKFFIQKLSDEIPNQDEEIRSNLHLLINKE